MIVWRSPQSSLSSSIFAIRARTKTSATTHGRRGSLSTRWISSTSPTAAGRPNPLLEATVRRSAIASLLVARVHTLRNLVRQRMTAEAPFKVCQRPWPYRVLLWKLSSIINVLGWLEDYSKDEPSYAYGRPGAAPLQHQAQSPRTFPSRGMSTPSSFHPGRPFYGSYGPNGTLPSVTAQSPQ